MQNTVRNGSRSLGAVVKEFFAWLRGFGAPKYVPEKIRYQDGGKKSTIRESD
jgi:hypothetical protein